MESESEFSTIKETEVKERGFENELEKETTEKDTSEQEKVRNVFTNHHVSKDSFGKFQLHFLPDERRFKFINKGKIVDELYPQVLKGKTIYVFEPQQLKLNVVEKVTGDIVFKRPAYFALVNCHFLFVVDNFVLSGGMKSCLLDVFCIEKSVDAVRLIQLVQTLDVTPRNGFLLEKEGMQTTYSLFKVFVNLRFLGAFLSNSSPKRFLTKKDFSRASGPI
ncbi:hypothetical protein PVK06_008476 [Gossypium arboreum]|uniref:Uncharacterized protein n=1 Tax=Gossypium arboreum TaxID=29729 RepID=A0ABR0QK89_GOSAR|nr:hypothetical protein PVK06_008476 [Gossypium arboreum]